jgi:hypothetical protein
MQRQALRAIAHRISTSLADGGIDGPASREMIYRELSIACTDPRNTGLTDDERELIVGVMVPRDLAKIQRTKEGLSK